MIGFCCDSILTGVVCCTELFIKSSRQSAQGNLLLLCLAEEDDTSRLIGNYPERTIVSRIPGVAARLRFPARSRVIIRPQILLGPLISSINYGCAAAAVPVPPPGLLRSRWRLVSPYFHLNQEQFIKFS